MIHFSRVLFVMAFISFLSAPAFAELRTPAWSVKELFGLGGKNTDEAGKNAGKKAGKTKSTKDAERVGADGKPVTDKFEGNIIGNFTKELEPDPNIVGEDKFTYDVATKLRGNKAAIPMLLADPGVGKTATWQYIQHLLGKEPPLDPRVAHLAGKKIVTLNLSDFLGGTQLRGDAEDRVKQLINELNSDEFEDYIVVYDEFSNFLEGGEEAKKILNELKTVWSRETKVFQAANMTEDEYYKHMNKDPAIASRFTVLSKEEPGEDVVKLIIASKADQAAAQFGVQILPDKLEIIYRLSTAVNDGFANPRKAEKILKSVVDAAVQARQAGDPIIWEFEDALKGIKSEIDKIEKGREQGIHKYFGRRYKKRLPNLEARRDQMQEFVDQFWEDFEATKDQREELLEGVRRKGEIQEEVQNAINNNIETEDLYNELREIDERMRTLASEISDVNSMLVTTEVTEDHIFDAVAHSFKQSPDDLRHYIQGDEGIQESLERITNQMAGQKNAIRQLVSRIRSKQRGLIPGDGSEGFLLLGPSSVGKTYLAQLIAKEFTLGNYYTMAMGEVIGPGGLTEHIGASAGHINAEKMGKFYEEVKKAMGLITYIVDEPEKGPDETWAMFFEILREGRSQTKNTAEEIPFHDALGVFPSNAVTELDEATKIKLAQVAGDDAAEQAILREYVLREAKKNGVNFPEGFLNRVHIAFMDHLSREEIREVAAIQLRDKKWLGKMAKAHDITFEFDDSVVEYISQRAMTTVGDVTGVKDVIKADIAPFIGRLLDVVDGKPPKIVAGDVVELSVRYGDDGEADLMYYAKPWDEPEVDASGNPRVETETVIDYQQAMANKDRVLADVKKHLMDEEFAAEIGFSKINKVDTKGLDNKITKWMKDEGDFDRVMSDLELKEKIKLALEPMNKEKLANLAKASSVEIQILPLPANPDDLMIRIVAYKQDTSGGALGLSGPSWKILNAEGKWVDYVKGEAPENLNLPSVLVTPRLQEFEDGLARPLTTREVPIVRDGAGAEHRRRAILQRAGRLDTNPKLNSAKKLLKDVQDMMGGLGDDGL